MISYAITVNDELDYLENLLSLLDLYRDPADEIVVQIDSTNINERVRKYVDSVQIENLKSVEYPLNSDFANFKNNLFNVCSGDWIFQIDADEEPRELLIQALPQYFEEYPDVEVLWVPRINTVEGITDEHIKKWNWNYQQLRFENGESYFAVNFPDYQCRIYRNVDYICWRNKVHEVLDGYREFAYLPTEVDFCLMHHKTISRQEKQNEFYRTIPTKF